jgi:hypothetical protein
LAYLEQLLLLGKVTWNISCSLGYLEQLLLLGKVTWNISCSLGYLEQLDAPGEGNLEQSMLLEKVTWKNSCSCRNLPGTAHTLLDEYLEQLLFLSEGCLEVEQLLLSRKDACNRSCSLGRSWNSSSSLGSSWNSSYS